MRIFSGADRIRSSSKWLSVAMTLLALGSAAVAHAQKLVGDVVLAPVVAAKLPAVAAELAQPMKGAEPVLTANVRSRAIGIDRETIRLAAREFDARREISKTVSVRSAAQSLLLQLSFFNDAVFLVELTGSERTQSGGQALVGRVAGDPTSSAVLVDNDGVTYIALAQGGKRYVIKGSPQSGYVAEQLAAEAPLSQAAKNDAIRVELPPGLQGSAGKSAAKSPAKSAANSAAKSPAQASVHELANDDGSLIDLMVIYSPAAKVLAGGAAQIEAMIDAEVAFTNLIYQNSEVVPRLRLVYKGEVVYTEGNYNADLYAINQPTDGILDEIPILRDVFRADLVSVWGQYPAVCGVAYIGDNENSYNGTFAISLVHAPQCTGPGQASMAHELGHSMGLRHDIASDGGSTWVSPEAGGNVQMVNYAHGYLDSVNRFRDVMAYDSCGIANPGVQCPRIPYFSNPALLYDNHAWYSGAVAAPLGDVNTANNHQAMNDTRETIAAYRPQLSAGELAGPGFVAFTERVVRVAEGASTVSLKVRRLGSAGAVSVNYAAAAVTAAAGADFSGVSGTLTWADGDSSNRTMVVPILQDSLLEGDEIFNVVLGGATGGLRIGGATGAGTSVRVVIADDEPDVFPPGASLPAGFTTSSGQPWTVDNAHGYQSPSSLRSAHAYAPTPSGSSANSDLEYTGTFGSGNISFAYRVGSVPMPYAGTTFEFSIDGVVKATASGGVFNWTTVSEFISAGTHTLRWRFTNTHYNKCINFDEFDERCDDYAYIDSVVMPAVQPNAPVSRYAYIANNGSASVSVINLASNTVVATIPVAAGPFGVAAHPDGTRVYVTSFNTDTLSVIDVFTQTVIATMPTGSGPYGVAVTPDGARVVVAHRNSAFTRVFNTVTNTLVQDIATTFHGYGLALNPAGTKAYITGDSSVRVVDLVAMTSQTVSIGLPGSGIAMSPDGARYAVVMNGDKLAKVFDATTNTSVRQDNLDGQPVGVAYNPVSNRIYYTTGATNGTKIGNSVMTFDTVTPTVGVVTGVGTAPYGIAVSLEGSRVYTANSNSANVTVLDTTNNAVVATIPVGATPQSLGLFITRTSRPAPPRSLAAAPGSMQTVLSFTVPVDNGGHAITQYDATCQPGNITAGGSSSPLTVTGLTNGTAYTCNVTASNVRGQSDSSATVTVTPGTGSYITSAPAATFTVLNAGAFNITTSGLPVTSVTATGALPAGLTLDSSGLLFGTPASGSAGTYPLVLTAANGVGAPGTQNFTLTVARVAQVLNFPVIADRSLASGTFTLTIIGGASAQPVTVASAAPAVCTVSGMNVTLVSPGTCTLAANQAGGTDYNAATQVTRSFVVRNTQAIVISNAPANLMYNATFTLSATGGPSGNPVVFTSATPAVCTATGANGVTITGVTQGTCTVNANQAGNTAYDAAPQVSASFAILIATQVITYSTAPLQIGLATNVITSIIGPNQPPVVLTTSTPVTCSVSGAMVTALQFGPCQLAASQAGNSNYLAAADVAFTLKSFAPLNVLRHQHTATLLNNGRILVAGGGTAGIMHATAELYDPTTRLWTATGSMSVARKQHTATLLADGRVLVTGGISSASAVSATAEIYNPATGTWGAAGTFASAVARMQHSAVRMNDGRVLIAGGNNTTTFVPTAAVDIYDPATNTWSAGAALPDVRYDHAAVLLPNGRPMLIGGALNGSVNYNSTLIYDPAANTWSSGASMASQRNQPTATTLADGRILVVGGGASTSVPTAAAERYDPVANTWSAAGSLPTPRYGISATLLANGRVLVAGGANGFNGATVVNTTSLYDPASNAWTSVTPMLVTRYYHSGTLLADGGVMLAGGKKDAGSTTNTSEVYLPELTLFSADLVDAAVGTALADLPLSVGAGIGPYSFAVTGGALPPGTSLTTAGVFSGTPSVAGNYSFTVTVTDTGNGNATASRNYSLLVGYIVTPTLTGDGTISPNAAKVYAVGSSPVFNFTKGNSSYLLTVAGSCGGSLAGTVFTVAALTGPCTVAATIDIGPPSAPFIGSATAGNTQATVTFSSPSNNGGSAILSYFATSSPDGKTGSCTTPCSNIAVTGLTNGTAYTFTVQAVNVAGAGAASSASNSVTPKGTQSIVFGSTPGMNVGATATIPVTGGASGNPVVLTTTTPANCTIAGLDVTAVSAGTCTLRANQAGNAFYNAATQVQRSITIAGPRTITPSAGANGTINPSTPVSAANGSTSVFTVTPNIGYAASMSGTCGGSLVGTTFTTNTISADCTVVATFTQVFFAPDAPTIGTATAGNTQATIAFSPPANDGGSTITSYTATCGAFTASGSSSPLVVTGLANGTSYTCSVKATNVIGTGPASATVSVTPIAAQVITFGSAPTITVGGTGSVSATGGASGNPILFSSLTPGVCSSGGVNGSLISGTSAGTCTIAANQAGNANYNAAPQMTQSFSIGRANQVIAFGTAPTISIGGTGTVSATGGASGNPVTFASTTASVCTISGTTVTGVTAGTCIIAANQTGNANYNAAPQVTQTFSIGLANQTINFGAAPAIAVGGAGTVSATGGASGNAIVFTSTTTSICTVSGATVTGVIAGNCIIAANQAGNANYNAAPQVTQNFSIGLASQTIAFGAVPTILVSGTGTVTATGGASGNAVVFTSATASVCTVSGATVTGLTAGTCTIAANQAGNANYNAAPQATQSFSIGLGNQAITFGTAPTIVVGGIGTVSATGGASGNPLVFTSATTGVCTVSGTTVTGVTAGTCTVRANQAGNASYNAAPQATQNISIGLGSQAITFGTAPTIVVGGTGIVSASGGASGNAVIFTSATTAICTVSGVNGSTVNGVTAGTCTIRANQAGNASYNAAPQATQNISIGLGSQAITFDTAPTIVVGGTGIVSATGGASGNPVVFTSATTAVCTVSGVNGSVITGVTAGTCTIRGNQAGNANYNAAPQTTQSFSIGLANQTITFGTAPTITVGGTGIVSATGGASGNPVVFTSTTTSVCTVSGSTATGVTAGTCTIAANQAGNANYNAAPQATQTFSIGLANQAITFGTAPTIAVGGTGIVSATGGASGNPVILSSTTTAVCTISGTTVTGVIAGTCIIAANQAGNANYNAAPQVTQNFSIGLATQTITFGTAPTIAVGGTGTVSATGGASGNPIVFTSTTMGVCTVSGTTVTGVSAGACIIAASQAGNASYGAAPQVTQSISVGLAAQAIVFATAPTIAVGGTGTVSATGGASGNPVVFTSTTTAVCTVSGVNGSTVTSLTAGTCTIAANQVGNASYNAAPQVTQNINIGLTAQTINFGSAPALSVGGTGTVSATGGASGNAVVFTSTTSAVCTVSGVNGSTVTGVSSGTCVIAANQAGNASYNAAPQVTLTFTVGPASPTITFTGEIYSRKNHGAAGNMDLPIRFYASSGAISVEPRIIGSGHQILFRFNNTVTSVTSVSVANGSSMPIGSAAASFAGNDLIITLTGIPDNTRVTVSATGVNGVLNVSRAMGFLVGDVNDSRSVSGHDLVAVKARSGHVTDANNFKYDINVSGSINAVDVSAVKARDGLVMP